MCFATFMCLLNTNFKQKIRKVTEERADRAEFIGPSAEPGSNYSLMVHKTFLGGITTSYFKVKSITQTFCKFLLISNSL